MESQLYELCSKLVDYTNAANEKLSQFKSIAPAANSERHLLNLATSFAGISTQRQLQNIQLMIPKALIDNAYDVHNRVAIECYEQVKNLVTPFSDDTIKKVMPEFASYVLKLEIAAAWINGRANNFTTDPAFLSSFIRDGYDFLNYATSIEDELISIFNVIKNNLGNLKKAELVNKIFFNKWAYSVYVILGLIAAFIGGDKFYGNISGIFSPKKVEKNEIQQLPHPMPAATIPLPPHKKLNKKNKTGPQ